MPYTYTEVQWSFLLEDGYCTDSLGLHTARQLGVLPEIITEAERYKTIYRSMHSGNGYGGGADDGDGVVEIKRQTYETSQVKTEKQSESKAATPYTIKDNDKDSLNDQPSKGHDMVSKVDSTTTSLPQSSSTVVDFSDAVSTIIMSTTDSAHVLSGSTEPTLTPHQPSVPTNVPVSLHQQVQPPSDAKPFHPSPSSSSKPPPIPFGLSSLVSYVKNNITSSTTTTSTTIVQVENEKGFSALLTNITSLFFSNKSSNSNNSTSVSNKALSDISASAVDTHTVVSEANISITNDAQLPKSVSGLSPSPSGMIQPPLLPVFSENLPVAGEQSTAIVTQLGDSGSVFPAHDLPSSPPVLETSIPVHATMTMTPEALHAVSGLSSSTTLPVIADTLTHSQTQTQTTTEEGSSEHVSLPIESMPPQLIDSISASSEGELKGSIHREQVAASTTANVASLLADFAHTDTVASAVDSSAAVETHVGTAHIGSATTSPTAQASSTPAVAFISTQNIPASMEDADSIPTSTDISTDEDPTSTTNTLPSPLPTPPSTTTTSPTTSSLPLPLLTLTHTNRLLITLDEIHAVVDFNAGTRTGAIKRTSDQLLPMELAGKSCVYVLLIKHEVSRLLYTICCSKSYMCS